MHRTFRTNALGRTSVLVCIGLSAPLWAATGALAGQPWSCLCDGKPKRSIASTYACEADLYKESGRRIRSGSKLAVPRCTAPQFRAWNRRACASIGCSLVPR
jgi:hypothetical protein